MKTCSSCQWYLHEDDNVISPDKCVNPGLPAIRDQIKMAMMIGSQKGTKTFSLACDTARLFKAQCGEEGRFWEPKDGRAPEDFIREEEESGPTAETDLF